MDEASERVRVMKGSSFRRQLAVMLRISFLRKFRAPTVWIELALPLLFLVFVCVFARSIRFYTDPLEHTTVDPFMPYAAVPGPDPHYGVIGRSESSKELLETIEKHTITGGEPAHIVNSTIFFDTFEEYESWIAANRKIDEHFYSIEWVNSSSSNATRIRFSSNGMTLDSVPDLMRTVTESLVDVSKGGQAFLWLNYAKMPSKSQFSADTEYHLHAVIFSSVLFVSPIITAVIYYGHEAETGLRDLFAYFGLSPSVNRMRWYIECFLVNFVLSIPFCLALWGIVGVNLGLLILAFFLFSNAITSFAFFLVALHPTEATGKAIGLVILLSVFVFIFWGAFTWLHTTEGYYEKRVLSVLPQAAIPYTLAQILAGYCTEFRQINSPDAYPVSMGLIYLAVETVVYYILFVIADTLRPWKWFPAPFKWGYQKPTDDTTPIVVQGLTKQYGKDVFAVNNVSFEVPLGETLAIVGPNGAGKSTLMGLISGSKVPTHGRIEFCGVDTVKNLRTVHSMVGLCPQENLFMKELRATEWIETLAVLRGNPSFDYSEIFCALGLDTETRSRIGDMSGGNKRKVCLASALVCNPRIVILDEATSGVDFTSRTRIWSLISGLKNTTVIMATHTLEECEKIADRIMVLADGRISSFATPTELRQQFGCGYLIETADENANTIRDILDKHGLSCDIEVSDQKLSVVLPADFDHLAGILREFDFPYLLSIQSLEEKIFSKIHDDEHAAQQTQAEEDMVSLVDQHSVCGGSSLTQPLV